MVIHAHFTPKEYLKLNKSTIKVLNTWRAWRNRWAGISLIIMIDKPRKPLIVKSATSTDVWEQAFWAWELTKV
jgi:hypothetical protein